MHGATNLCGGLPDDLREVADYTTIATAVRRVTPTGLLSVPRLNRIIPSTFILDQSSLGALPKKVLAGPIPWACVTLWASLCTIGSFFRQLITPYQYWCVAMNAPH